MNIFLKSLRHFQGGHPTQSRKGMLSERKKALSGVEKLHNYTKIGDFKSLNGEGKQILSVDVSRTNNDRFVTGGQNNSVKFFKDFSLL